MASTTPQDLYLPDLDIPLLEQMLAEFAESQDSHVFYDGADTHGQPRVEKAHGEAGFVPEECNGVQGDTGPTVQDSGAAGKSIVDSPNVSRKVMGSAVGNTLESRSPSKSAGDNSRVLLSPSNSTVDNNLEPTKKASTAMESKPLPAIPTLLAPMTVSSLMPFPLKVSAYKPSPTHVRPRSGGVGEPITPKANPQKVSIYKHGPIQIIKQPTFLPLRKGSIASVALFDAAGNASPCKYDVDEAVLVAMGDVLNSIICRKGHVAEEDGSDEESDVVSPSSMLDGVYIAQMARLSTKRLKRKQAAVLTV